MLYTTASQTCNYNCVLIHRNNTVTTNDDNTYLLVFTGDGEHWTICDAYDVSSLLRHTRPHQDSLYRVRRQGQDSAAQTCHGPGARRLVAYV